MFPAYRKDRNFTTCPVCGSMAKIIYRDNGYADHYEINDDRTIDALHEIDDDTAAYLREKRGDKKTVAMVGKAQTTCSLAPFREKNVEIWTLTNGHKFPWMLRWDRLFEMHEHWFIEMYDQNQVAWLMQKHDKPIYMQFHHDNIPDSIEYPFRDIRDALLKNAYNGKNRVKYFSSSLSYMIALALFEGFERIECYGFEMSFDDIYAYQRRNAEFWMGIAIGRGVELYLPEACPILKAKLYGYETNNKEY